MANTRWLVLLLVAVTTTGCATTTPSLYQASGTAFSKGYTEANTAISAAIARAPSTLRIQQVQDQFVAGNGTYPQVTAATVTAFAKYVCLGTNSMQQERSALTLLSAYQAHIKDLTTDPSQSIGAVWADIQKNGAPAQPLELKVPGADNDCVDEVTFLSTKTTVDTGEAALPIFALYSAISTLITGLENAVVKTLDVVDDKVRAEALHAYIDKNRDQINDVLDNKLQMVDSKAQIMCKDVTIAPCKAFKNPPNTIDGALLRAKWAALRLPLYAYSELTTQSPALRTGGQYAEILILAKQMDDGIDGFQNLRAQPGPSNVVASMKKAEADLERLADGKATPSETWAALKAFADQLAAARTAITQVSTDYSAVTSTAEGKTTATKSGTTK
jgi:hypothetical protein